MAKLSEEVLEEGRQLLWKEDIDGFMEWVGRTGVFVDKAVVRQSYEFFFAAGAPEKAIEMFDGTCPKWDPAEDRRHLAVKLGITLLVVLGIVGGLGYLAAALFGN